jgi:hypothetical protein
LRGALGHDQMTLVHRQLGGVAQRETGRLAQKAALGIGQRDPPRLSRCVISTALRLFSLESELDRPRGCGRRSAA